MPRIGDWQDGMEVPTASLGFHLFRNPLVNKDTTVFVPDPGEAQLISLSGPVEPDQISLIRLRTPTNLKHAIGYASYVGQYEDDSGKLTPAKFIFCNGLYLDVFEVNSSELVLSHMISLEGLTPTLSRRFACEMTMDSISENMFLWVEDGGRYCSTWDLSNGSAITRLETSRWRYDNINKTKMSITRSQNIVAIVGFDNSITTFFADSGIEISRRRFMNRRVEFIGFASNQSTELFVVLRERSEEDFSSITLDPFRLDIEFSAPTIPIPTRSTIFCHFGQRLWTGRQIGVLCQPFSGDINFYHLNELSAIDSRGQGRVNLVMPRYITTSDNIHYELTTNSVSVEDTPIGGVEPSERLIKIWKISENPPTESTERTLVFSFVPEPWEQRAPTHGFFLPTGDRFVVYAKRTIQVWGLPVDKEPCKLLYFWSMFQPQPRVQRNKTEMELVLMEHKRFNGIHFHEYPSNAEQTRVRVNVVSQDKRGGHRADVRSVHVPNWPARLVDSRNTTENCFQSIRLLALAYSIVSSGYEVTQDTGLHNTSHQAHALAILNFVNTHINHTIYTERLLVPALHGSYWPPPTEKKLVTLWTIVLTAQHLLGLCTKLIADLLDKDDCSWIPRKYESINPILVAIRCKNSAAVEAFVDFCVSKTTDGHLAYMLPVVQSFQSLSVLYPDILRNLLRNSSYIPAQNMDFSKSHVTISGFNWRRLVGRNNPNSLEEYAFPVFSHHLIVLPAFSGHRTRLEAYFKPSGRALTTLATASTRSRSKVTKESTDVATTGDQSVEVPYYDRIYVAPFPRLSMYGADFSMGQNRGQSQFSQMAGKDFFDNPAMMAVLRFKLFELRVYRPLGIIVNIILRITYRIAWFFIIFAILIVGFTHTLIYVLYTSKPVCVPDESGKVPDNILDCTTALKAETDYPDGLLQGISGTLFFLAGRYDFLDKNFVSNSAAFHLTVIIFYFVMGLVSLNVLIALMNDAINQCGQEGQLAWLKQWFKMLDEVERIFLQILKIKKLHLLSPDYIYYVAPIEDAEKYRTPSTSTKKSSLSGSCSVMCDSCGQDVTRA
ncbi:hypothetical protein DFQ26_003884 [Actinomortierella ambigua]|nr:hypothetical protein DFQ26_003884 [Actinomortierella ambigua]